MLKKLPLFLTFFIAANAHAYVTDYEGGPIYITEKPIQETRAWQNYQKSPKSELSKMQYLINLTKESEREFIRNGMVLPGFIAAKGYLFKFRKHFDERGKNAREFIENLCTFSKKTGERYVIILPNGDQALMNLAMHNELDRLDASE